MVIKLIHYISIRWPGKEEWTRLLINGTQSDLQRDLASLKAAGYEIDTKGGDK